MRRVTLIPLLALVLAASACATGTSTAPSTVTQIVTATGTPPTTGTAGITVIAPGAGTSAASQSDTAGSTPAGGSSGSSGVAPSTPVSSGTAGTDTSPASSNAGTAASSAVTSETGPLVKVNPLTVNCPSLLDPSDIKKALGASVPSSSSRVVDVANPDVKMTGKTKCYFGVATGSDAKPVTVALAQYASATDAQKQMGVTVASETDQGAQASTVTVSGRPANVLIRAGGLLVMQYDTWTLSIAVADKLVAESQMSSGLQQLATMVLARVLKKG